jgi:pantoate--beta-alanine ligase
MLIVHSAEELQNNLKLKNKSLGLVPTMGALHQGHLSLIKRAANENKKVVVSIYVNPTQFNRSDDLDNYPKNIENDIALLKPFEKQLILYVPSHDDLYPEGIKSKKFDFGSLTAHMEGASRPGHFNGVATIVEALLVNIQPTKAYFGEKDFQQLQVIRALNQKLDLNIEIVNCTLQRANDGLALSSRNTMLTKAQRAAAVIIYQILEYLNKYATDWSVREMEHYFKSKVEAIKDFKVDYFSIAAPSDLVPISHFDSLKNYRVFVAVYAGETRLIDTIELVRK